MGRNTKKSGKKKKDGGKELVDLAGPTMNTTMAVPEPSESSLNQETQIEKLNRLEDITSGGDRELIYVPSVSVSLDCNGSDNFRGEGLRCRLMALENRSKQGVRLKELLIRYLLPIAIPQLRKLWAMYPLIYVVLPQVFL